VTDEKGFMGLAPDFAISVHSLFKFSVKYFDLNSAMEVEVPARRGWLTLFERFLDKNIIFTIVHKIGKNEGKFVVMYYKLFYMTARVFTTTGHINLV
jgi:hypothetical protein